MRWDPKLFLKKLLFRSFASVSIIRWFEWPKLLVYLHPRPNEIILDLASGDGSLALKIASAGSIVCGLDIAKDAVVGAYAFSANQGIKCDFIVGDAEHLPFNNETFDKIVCSSAVEHFSNSCKVFGEINRTLKKGGCLALAVDSLSSFQPSAKNLHQKRYRVSKYYTKETLEEVLAAVGIEIHRSEYLLNSSLTNYILQLILLNDYPGGAVFLASLIFFPICLISDRLFGDNRRGYSLIVTGNRTN